MKVLLVTEPVWVGMNVERWGWVLDVWDVQVVGLEEQELQRVEPESQHVEREWQYVEREWQHVGMVQNLSELAVEGHHFGTNGYQGLEPVAGTVEW